MQQKMYHELIRPRSGIFVLLVNAVEAHDRAMTPGVS